MANESHRFDSPPGKASERFPQRAASPWFQRIGLGVVISLFILILIGITLPSSGIPPESLRRMKTQHNLKEISSAVLKYEQVTGHLPPAYVADSSGRSLYSWRVLVLPYLGQQHLYEKFDLKEPWNSPKNLSLVAQMPLAFQSPYLQTERTEGLTSYQALVDYADSRTVIKAAVGECSWRIRDGASRTAMLIENREAPVVWTQPDDTDAVEFLVNLPQNRSASSICFANCDGSIWFLRGNPCDVMEGAMFPDDGKVPPR